MTNPAITSAIITAAIALPGVGAAQHIEPVRYGDFEQWVTRDITESVVIGGHHRTLYEVGPEMRMDGNRPYTNQGGSPWATSNVYAKVSGVTKGSNAVYPHDRTPDNRCARLTTQMEKVKVLGIINMNVMVAGSMFLGRMIEPISNTSNPYSKMEMGVPFTKRPRNVVFDYSVDMPQTDTRVKSTGFGPRKTLPGRDKAVVFMMLQRRWEEPDGSLHARRVATAGELFDKGTDWQNGHRLKLHYGDTSANPAVSWVTLRQGDNAYWAYNSKGKLVPVQEEGYDKPDAQPTHVVLMFSAGNGEPYVGTEGLTFYVDNVGFEY